MINVKQLVRVQSGHRVEVVAPEFAEGELVDVIVRPWSEPVEATPSLLLAFLDSLPDGPRAFSTWEEEYEQHRREERDSWDR